MTDAPLTYEELDELLRGDGRNDFIGLSAIDGMIAALVAGPAVVPKEAWLPLIFADHMPSNATERRAAATIMARYAEVDQILADKPFTYQPIFMHHLGQLIVRPWAIGFMMGLATCRDGWRALLLSPKRKQMLPILASSELGRPMLPEMSEPEIEQVAASASAHIAAAVLVARAFHEQKRRPSKLAVRRWLPPPRPVPSRRPGPSAARRRRGRAARCWRAGRACRRSRSSPITSTSSPWR